MCADFVGASLDAIHRKFGVRYSPEQVTEYDFGSLPGWEEIRDRYWSEVAKAVGFCGSFEPFPGAVEGVAALREVADVEFLTSPMHGSPTWVHERDAWLERHFGAHHRDVLHVRKKHRVKGDVFVDDYPQNVESWQQHHPNGTALMWTRPYNVLEPFMTVDNWGSLERFVRSVASAHNPP